MTLSKDLFLSTILLVLFQSSLAQDAELGLGTWGDEQMNQILNVRYDGINPTYPIFNSQQNSAFVKLNYKISRGSFYSPDHSGKENNLNVFFGGLKRHQNIYLYGSLAYENQQAKDCAWKSALWLNQLNPFFIGDSVKSEVAVEAFHMKGIIAYQMNKSLRMALQVGLSTGTFSDQTDPRPRVNSSIIPITLGMDWQVLPLLSIGLSGGIKFYNSDMAYTVVNNRVSHRFFIMKGMGDHTNLSTGAESGYQRDFKGLNYQGTFHAVLHQNGSDWSDFLEISYEKGDEEAEDGGSQYTFKGGDYASTKLYLSNRLQFKMTERAIHNLLFRITKYEADGTWYDQRMKIDTEHNNRQYYDVLASNKLHSQEITSMDFSYRFDKLKKGARDFYVTANIGIKESTTKHIIDLRVEKQKYTLAHACLYAGKSFTMPTGRIYAAVGGGIWEPIGDKTFGSAAPTKGASAVINPDYVRPSFEYESAQSYQIGAKVDYKIPVFNNYSSVGIYALVNSLFYGDNNTYSDRFDKKSLITGEAGLYLNF